jgi:hypothetical protein
MLTNAPKNPITTDNMNAGFAAAKKMTPEEKDAAMAGLADLQRQMAAKVGEGDGSYSMAGGKKATSSKSSELDDIPELGEVNAEADASRTLAAGDTAGLSPELQAVLAQKQTESVRAGSTIFQGVHRKYQEKLKMIYGFDARGKSISGVANADGF